MDETERYVHAYEHRLVREWVEHRAEPCTPVEALGDEPIERVRDPSADKNPECEAITAIENQPNLCRHQKEPR